MAVKRVLITGKNSYIGNAIEKWLMDKPQSEFIVEQLDVQSENWKQYDFSLYESIVHVAGIVHRKDIIDAEIYRKVNTELPLEIAQIAKSQGVKQFVFLSTMAVYGIGKKLKENTIDDGTPLNPTSLYAVSKYNAERLLSSLNDGCFNVVVVRPPNVYGKDCKGGYISGFTRIVRILPIIPAAYGNVRQSMIYIDNLCEFIYLLIKHNSKGVYMPQDKFIPSANDLMLAISRGIGKRGYSSKVFGRIMQLFSFTSIVKKAYGGIAYSEQITDYFDGKYQVVEFIESIRRTVANE